MENQNRSSGLLVTATGVLVIVIAVANYFILLPLGIPTEQVGGLIVSAVLPLTPAKGLLSAVITLLFIRECAFFWVRA